MAAVPVGMAPNSSQGATALKPSADTEVPVRPTCGEDGGTTILSVYNEYDFCSLHQPMIIPRLRGKVLD